MDAQLKILMVEDDPNDRDLIIYNLKKSGLLFEVRVVQTENDFSEALRTFYPDIILSDFSLPQFSGINAFGIKKLMAPDIPFIIVSGTIGEERAVDLIKNGITDYVVKDKVYTLAPKIQRALREATDKAEKARVVDELRHNEMLLAKAQRIAQLGSWEFELKTGVVNCSEEACRIFGVESVKNIQSLESMVALVHPDDLDYVLQKINEAYSSYKDIEFQHRIVTPQGVVKNIYSESKFEFAEDGTPASLYGVLHDITKLKRAEEEVRVLNIELEERVKLRTSELEIANKQLETFSSTVSHDLRSPLQIINGYASILNRKYNESLTEEGRTLLQGIKENTKQMGQLIDDLLSFSRLGRTEPVKKALDMNELVQMAISQLRLSHDNLKARFRFQELAPGYGDRGLIYQVWVNLIANAVKYSSKENSPIIEVGATKNDSEIVYYVKDNGVGFDMKLYEKLFNIFQRLHKASDFEGTGVGLALVHAIISKHGGRLWAEGRINEGATFYFTLPSAPMAKPRRTINTLSVI